MLNRSSKSKGPRNTKRAKSVADIAAGKDPAAVALGRKGGLVGGKARAARLSAETRRAIAKKAAQVRWGKRE